MKKGRVSAKKAAVIIVVISLIGKVFGFARELLLANYFGTSKVVDVYLMSVTIPSIFFGFLPSLGIGFTPVYYKIKEEDRRHTFLNNILICSAAIGFLCIVLTVVFKNQIVNLCAPGFEDSAKVQTSSFLLITVWAVFFNTPVQLLTAYLNCKKNYIVSNVSNLFVSIIQAVFVIIAAKFNVIFLPIGVVLPWIFQVGWLSYSANQNGHRFSLYKKGDQYVKKIFALSAPLFFSSILVDINGFVDKMLSSSLPAGRLSALNYSFTLRAVFVTAASTVISTIVYPRISEKIICGDKSEAQLLIAKYTDIISYIVVPICLICCFYSQEIVRIVLMRGNFDYESLQNTSSPFLAYSVSLAILVWRELIIRIMYSNGRTFVNLKYSTIEILLNVLLSIILVNRYEQTGLAIATSIAAIIVFPLYIKELNTVLQSKLLKGRIFKIIKILISSALATIVSLIAYNLFDFSPNSGIIIAILHLGISLLLGATIYFLFSILLRVEESKYLIDWCKDKFHIRN